VNDNTDANETRSDASDWSVDGAVLESDAATPDKVAQPTITLLCARNRNCDSIDEYTASLIIIEWVAPEEDPDIWDSNPVTSYNVEFLKNHDDGGDWEWESAADCNPSNANTLSCTISLDVFLEDPFNLPLDHYFVRVKVQAINDEGEGPWSDYESYGVAVDDEDDTVTTDGVTIATLSEEE
jgi:hypothetical protein